MGLDPTAEHHVRIREECELGVCLLAVVSTWFKVELAGGT